MPVYEYYCERCDKMFEALRSIRESDEAMPCPQCGNDAERIMPTSFSAMSWKGGYPQRVPYHQRPVRNVEPRKPTVAPVKGKAEGKKGKKARTKG